MRERIWISFDLAFGGDESGMREWLLKHKAKECGPNLATLYYAFTEDLLPELERDLKLCLSLGAADRIYVIYKDQEDGEVTGRFLVGRRTTGDDTLIDGPINRMN